MKQIYLIERCKVDEMGYYKSSKQTSIFQVYTNRKLAKIAVEYLNKEWKEACTTKNFKNVWWYVITTITVSTTDYSKLTF